MEAAKLSGGRNQHWRPAIRRQADGPGDPGARNTQGAYTRFAQPYTRNRSRQGRGTRRSFVRPVPARNRTECRAPAFSYRLDADHADGRGSPQHSRVAANGAIAEFCESAQSAELDIPLSREVQAL